MDRKRPYQYRALRQLSWLLAVGCWLLAASCTWVKDDSEDCPYGFWLKLHYTYNILDVEAASTYVKDAEVYIYDADGNHVRHISVGYDYLKAHDDRIEIVGLDEGDYQFVVWSGAGSPYVVSGDTEPISHFRLSLPDGSRSATDLPALFHGFLPTVHYDSSYAQYDVSMMKDTNQLACLVVSVSDEAELDAGDFHVKVVSDNGTMNAYNQHVSDVATVYEPFAQDDIVFDTSDYGELRGIRYGITTLRLMSDGNSRLILERKSSGQTLADISLPEIFGTVGPLYTSAGREITVQEYLDRQDFYTIVFFLSGDLSQFVQLQVNSWRLRAKNFLKL